MSSCMPALRHFKSISATAKWLLAACAVACKSACWMDSPGRACLSSIRCSLAHA